MNEQQSKSVESPFGAASCSAEYPFSRDDVEWVIEHTPSEECAKGFLEFCSQAGRDPVETIKMLERIDSLQNKQLTELAED